MPYVPGPGDFINEPVLFGLYYYPPKLTFGADYYTDYAP